MAEMRLPARPFVLLVGLLLLVLPAVAAAEPKPIAKPAGAYYILTDVAHWLPEYGCANDHEFAMFLVKDIGVATVPGSSFYSRPELGRTKLRFAFPKRLETLQMSLFEPKLAILDETDSGLDIDALRVVAQGVNTLRAKDRAFLVITHYQRLLNYIKPDSVHVMAAGRIVKTGGPELALELEKNGYRDYVSEAA